MLGQHRFSSMAVRGVTSRHGRFRNEGNDDSRGRQGRARRRPLLDPETDRAWISPQSEPAGSCPQQRPTGIVSRIPAWVGHNCIVRVRYTAVKYKTLRASRFPIPGGGLFVAELARVQGLNSGEFSYLTFAALARLAGVWG